MQLFEIFFLLVLLAGIIRLCFGPLHPRLTYGAIGIAGCAVLVPGIIIEGLSWRMMPAYLAFGLLMLAMLKKSETRALWRRLGAVPLVLFGGLSVFFTTQMPVVSLPAPSGPYAVGTFDYSITDPARKERFAPERNRELYVEVWYPADKAQAAKLPVRTLFQELYEGGYTRHSFLFGYLKNVSTHSHVKAPIAAVNGKRFPVLLFNHGLAPGFTSQNQLLMEHLASHGYVVFSIAHPYQTAKANLQHAGTVSMVDGRPADLKMPRPELPEGPVGKIFRETHDMQKISALRSVLLPLAEPYLALNEEGRRAFVKQVLARPDVQPFRNFLSEDMLEDFFLYEYYAWNSVIQYWVEDVQTVANGMGQLQAPVAAFSDAIDTSGFGVFGMSVGGATATEFCKVDKRCKAGVNLDGTDWGRHWDRPVMAPFLMFYNEGHQSGNDFAYLPPAHPFWDYKVKGASHFDFTDFTYAAPLFKTAGLSGKIDGWRMIHITNSVVLNFWDHTLKGKAFKGELFTDIPEIEVRHHKIVARPEGEPVVAAKTTN